MTIRQLIKELNEIPEELQDVQVVSALNDRNGFKTSSIESIDIMDIGFVNKSQFGEHNYDLMSPENLHTVAHLT